MAEEGIVNGEQKALKAIKAPSQNQMPNFFQKINSLKLFTLLALLAGCLAIGIYSDAPWVSAVSEQGARAGLDAVLIFVGYRMAPK